MTLLDFLAEIPNGHNSYMVLNLNQMTARTI